MLCASWDIHTSADVLQWPVTSASCQDPVSSCCSSGPPGPSNVSENIKKAEVRLSQTCCQVSLGNCVSLRCIQSEEGTWGGEEQ